MTRITKNSSVLRYEVAVYRGDDLIDTGTIKEVAERRGVNPETIRFYLTGAYERRLAQRETLDKSITVVRTDLPDEEEL